MPHAIRLSIDTHLALDKVTCLRLYFLRLVADPRLPVIHARGRIRPFALLRPANVREAAVALGPNQGRTRAMAGGIDVINALKCGEHVEQIVYLRDIAELRGIRCDAQTVDILAATTHREIERSPMLAAALPDLLPIVRDVGNIRTRVVGTIGGNLMAGHRNYDWLPIVAALEGELVFTNGDTSTSIPAERLATASGGWSLPDGLLTTIRISIAGRPRLRFIRRFKPVLSIAVCLRTDENGQRLRVAVGCMHAAPVVCTPRYIDAIESEIGHAIAADLPDAHDDGYASAGYRRYLAGTLIGRTIAEMVSGT